MCSSCIDHTLLITTQVCARCVCGFVPINYLPLGGDNI